MRRSSSTTRRCAASSETVAFAIIFGTLIAVKPEGCAKNAGDRAAQARGLPFSFKGPTRSATNDEPTSNQTRTGRVTF